MISIAGDANFFNNAKAGAVTIVSSGGIGFTGTSSAQNANLTMLPDAFASGYIIFDDTSTADHATITVERAVRARSVSLGFFFWATQTLKMR